MPSRCLNRVMLIGNLTRDPELRYTPGGMAVTSFGIATNRVWSTKQGEKKEDAQFHRIVAWNKLAELCSQLLAKGRRVFVEGRLQYREWSDNEGQRRQVAEIVIDDMIVLDNKGFNRGEADVYGENAMGVADTGSDGGMAVGEVSSPIDDIVIPDDINDSGMSDSPVGQDDSITPSATSSSDDSKGSKKKSPKKEEKGEEEMPF